jgi:hypothetical protein
MKDSLWAIFDPDGDVLYSFIGPTRKTVLDDFTTPIGPSLPITWARYRKAGYRCKRIRIEVVG